MLFCLTTPLQGVVKQTKQPHAREQTLYFYSAMRSGTHWMFYILKHFTKRPLTTFGHTKKLQGLDLYGQGSVAGKPYIHHSHFAPSHLYPEFKPGPPNRDKDRILLIVRNPVECTVRQARDRDFTFQEIVDWVKTPNFGMYANLAIFDQWPQESRYLVYYEDLLIDPAGQIGRLLDFLGESRALLPGFLAKIEQHKAITLQNYENWDKSYTKGKDLHYHSKTLTNEELAELRALFMEKNPYLWQAYLSRY